MLILFGNIFLIAITMQKRHDTVHDVVALLFYQPVLSNAEIADANRDSFSAALFCMA